MQSRKTFFPNPGIPQILIPVIISLSSFLAAHFAGFEGLTIPFNAWQLLDAELLLTKPFQSLALLHAQPPGLNVILAVILKTSSLLSIHPEFITQFLFVILGTTASIYLYKTVIKITNAHLLAACSVLIYSFNPTSWVYGHTYFYPYILACLFIFLAYQIQNIFLEGEHKEQKRFLLFTAAVLVISNLRSLYHPVWGISLFFLVAALYLNNSGRSFRKFLQTKWAIILILFLGLLVWPLKNKILFGQFTASSWQGFNLSRGTEVTSEIVENYRREGILPEHIQGSVEQFQTHYGISKPNVISQIEKRTGGRNWNHYLFLDQNPRLTRQAALYRLQNPLRWIKQTIFHYITWTRPSYINPYTGEIFGPDTLFYQQYTQFIKKTLFYDLRPPLGTLVSPSSRWPYVFRLDKDVPFTFFGFVFFPVLEAFSIILIRKKWLMGKKQESAFLAAIFFSILWVLVIPCLTDGFEGNRMRYAIFPLLIIQLFSVLGSLNRRIKLSGVRNIFL